MDPFVLPIPFARRDGRWFDIEAVRLALPDGELRWVPRVFEDGRLVNRGSMPRCGDAEQAFAAGFDFARSYDRTRPKVTV